MQPRYYQTNAIDEVYKYFRGNPPDRQPIVVMPTGSGKTIVIKQLCHDVVEHRRGRVVVLAHRKELLSQTDDKITTGKVSVYSASLKRKELDGDVILAQVQSIHKKAYDVGKVDLLIVDECHLVSPDEETMFAGFIADLRVINPNLRVVGLTATPYRMKEGEICSASGPWHGVCYEYPVDEAVRMGFLTPLVSFRGKCSVDDDGLHVRAGEFVTSEVEQLVDGIIVDACDDIIEKTQDRNSVLVFCVSVKHVMQVVEQLEKKGHVAKSITGVTPIEERNATIEEFNAGDIKFLVNCDVLTTGFDSPRVDAIAMLRPTKSRGLFVQIAGRGMRLFEGKADCIAEGQLITTDHGLVPIEHVTTDMRVWDGVEFVEHDGVICKGEQNVITYDNVTATPDHLVWCEDAKWRTLSDAKRERIPIMGGGACRRECRPERYSQRPNDVEQLQSNTRALFVRNLRHNHLAATCGPACSIGEDDSKKMLRRKGAQMVEETVLRHKTTVRPRLEQLKELLRSWNQVLLSVTDRHGNMDDGQHRNKPRPPSRSNRQRWTLRTWEYSHGTCRGEHQEPPNCGPSGFHIKTATESPGSRIRGCNNTQYALQWNAGAGYCGQMASHERQEYREKMCRVYDILNCGPRNRFVCQGRIVHNCLFLDYGSNVRRHGPIDAPYHAPRRVAHNGNADPRATIAKDWECPECGRLNSEGTQCLACPYVRTRPVNHDTRAANEEIMRAAGVKPIQRAWRDVVSTSYARHHARDPNKPNTFRVDYYLNDGNEHVSEWVCFEHEGFARQKAIDWWKKRSHEDVPDTIDRALDLAGACCVAEPISIHVDTTEKWPRIVGVKLGPIPAKWLATEDDPDPWWENADSAIDIDDLPF